MHSTVHVFIALILGHLLADFPLQINTIYAFKFRGWWGLIPHVLVHVLVTSLFFIQPARFWPLFLSLFLTHYVIDWGKLHWATNRPSRAFLIDQGLHAMSLFLMAVLLPAPPVLLPLGVLIGLSIYALFPAMLVFRTIRTSERTAVQGAALRGQEWMRTARMVGFSLVLTLLVLRMTRMA